jgi:hypothetical protein
MTLRSLLFAALLAAAAPASAQLYDVLADPVDFDRWMYPFNGTPGTRNVASTFGSIDPAPTSAFDNKDGQLIVWVNTVNAGIPSGQGATHYYPISVRLTATHFDGDFVYDPSYDAWQTYLDPLDPSYVADSDPGRPIEVYGVGVRNGYALPLVAAASGTAGPPGFEENDRFCDPSPCNPIGVARRNVFAWDPGAADPEGDVSNNVLRLAPLTGGGFDPFAWAVGRSTSGLLPGATVPEGVFGVSPGETFEFELDLEDPEVYAYVREGLDDGVLAFAIVSMHDAAEMAGGTNPNFYASESTDAAALPPTMEVVAVVPEPGAGAGLASCCIALALLSRRRAPRRPPRPA